MSNHHAGHQIAHVAHIVEKLDPLPEKKNPLVAAALGFCFGAIGVGIYFRSWKDTVICLAVFLPLAMTGVLAIPGWWFAAAYGLFRAVKSNEHRDAVMKHHSGVVLPPVIIAHH